MNYTISTSANAPKALKLVEHLQRQLVSALEMNDTTQTNFAPIHWLRDNGIHGGGTRFMAEEGSIFNRASVNVSHVHYDDLPEKALQSATALSAIVHPKNPLSPSVHMHFSWTELRKGKGYWRMMADLNPSNPNKEDTSKFDAALKKNAGDHYKTGRTNGDDYFYIPALDAHRGTCHFYLEGFNRGHFEEDYQFAENLAGKMIETYSEILKQSLLKDAPSQAEIQNQIDYHTLYVYQVLTLDKGTIAGILVHNQNDLGVFGSLPRLINGELFRSWIDKTPAPYKELVAELAKVVSDSAVKKIEDKEKLAFGQIIRDFYKKHPVLADFRNKTLHK